MNNNGDSMQKLRYVQGGTELWEGVDPLPRKRKLDHEQEVELFEMVRKGRSNREISKRFGIAPDSVRQYYRRTLRERGLEQGRGESKERIVALRKAGGKLAFSVDGGYVGHTTVGGVGETCRFIAKDDAEAIRKFDRWLADMRDEQEFLDRIERKQPEQEQPETATTTSGGEEPLVIEAQPLTEDVVVSVTGFTVTPAPVPEVNVRPWREVAEERQRRIEELERELDEARTQRVEFVEGYQLEAHNPAYLIWAKQPEPRCYGLFLTMDAALAELDRLNDVARFLGSDGAFEVEEVEWKVGR